ncbi:tyrosine-type recombinase/integrase [Rheinheimera fenheensis]|uniref:tyrosine-type recombinase/integrase n=1 Tax=Rheinheimera fenheensis TaxID=3152295 RepID=UPI003260C3FA
MQSVALVISDAAINRHAADVAVGELRDHKSPLVLRFHKARDKATWYLVQYQHRRKQRHRLGYWPALKTKDAQAMVPDLLKKLGTGAEVQNSQFVTVGQLLQWYKKRVEQETLKSQSRRSGVINVIDKHLLQRLGAVRITAVTKAVIDEKLMLPLQSDGLMPGTIRNYFGVLKRAFATAYELDLISIDPLAGMKFVDYIQRRIMARESKLLTSDRQQVLDAVLGYEPAALVLQLLMLMFALRIGEARQLANSMVRFDRGLLAIPARITKTGHDNNLPLTTWASAVLSAVVSSNTCDHLITVNRQPLTKDQAQKLIRTTAAGKYRSHDLRKLARSTWAEMGMDYWVSERLLNHRQKGQDQAYIKADAYEVKLAALQQYHDLLFAGFDVGTMQALIKSKLRCGANKNAA